VSLCVKGTLYFPYMAMLATRPSVNLYNSSNIPDLMFTAIGPRSRAEFGVDWPGTVTLGERIDTVVCIPTLYQRHVGNIYI
jgi:hypothetical protein